MLPEKHHPKLRFQKKGFYETSGHPSVDDLIYEQSLDSAITPKDRKSYLRDGVNESAIPLLLLSKCLGGGTGGKKGLHRLS